MKVSIIGGGGRVGSNAAFALQCAGIVSEIHILDANEQMAAGEALDLIHGTSVAGDQKIYAGNYEKCADSDMVVITAGLRRKPDESRLDLINRNVTLFKQILDSLRTAGLKKDAIVHQYVDESIIGGLVLRVEDKLIDASVRSQLELMKRQLLAARPK